MDNRFSYTYSAGKQSEVEKIRSKYAEAPAADDPRLRELKRLDRSCERPGTIAGIILGIVGTLIFGCGLAVILSGSNFALGIPVGLAGLAVMGAALPLFRFITAVRRRAIAPEIMRLSEEISRGK